MIKKSQGFTLIEIVVALGLWVVLLSGVTGVLWYTAQVSSRLIDNQNTVEHARVALDALVVNLQMAEEIVLNTEPNGSLRLLRTYQASPNRCPAVNHENCNPLICIGGQRRHGFEFRFRPSTGRLYFGLWNELASNLSDVKLVQDGNFMIITIVTDDSTIFETAVDMRFRFE